MRSFQTNTKSNNGVRSMTKPDLALEALVAIPPDLIRTAPRGVMLSQLSRWPGGCSGGAVYGSVVAGT